MTIEKEIAKIKNALTLNYQAKLNDGILSVGDNNDCYIFHGKETYRFALLNDFFDFYFYQKDVYREKLTTVELYGFKKRILKPVNNDQRPSINLIVTGHKQHGKDTVCEILRDLFDLSFKSSSEMACELFLFDQLKERYGYQTVADCMADRNNHREEFFNAIVAYNTPHLDRLAKDLLAKHDIYCGMRNIDELRETLTKQTIDLTVWVDAHQRKPLESKKSLTITEEDTQVTIDNNHSYNDLLEAICQLYQVRILPIIRHHYLSGK